ncbi:hypothetical protein [Massilia sp. DWR3-1-1]|uniref:hypothetical protein n=1 Tax=Massilia sp. DWR3-1-1 TaxID=2804559 RepID=UPI003CF4B250
MPIIYTDELARFDGIASVEEAELLLEWVQTHPHGAADLAACTHLHAADLQVLMAGAVRIAAWPTDDTLRSWLGCALTPT